MDIDLNALSDLNPAVIEYLAHSPVVAPPPGKASNFVNPPTRAPLQIWITGVLLALALFFFANRIYIKARLIKVWTWDDVTLSITMVLTTGEYGLKTYGLVQGFMGRHLYDISMLRILQPDVPRFYYALLVTQAWILLFLKATYFLLYLHLFNRVRWVRISSWIGLTFVVVGHSAIGIYCFVVANPRESASWGHAAYGSSIALSAIGIVIDVAIFIIPYIAIAPLQLSTTKKWGASIIFLTGGCAVICSILNLYYRCEIRHSIDYSWDGIPAAIVTHSETLIGITCACIPTLAFGFRHTGSIYQRAFCLSTFVTSRAASQYPSQPDSRKKNVELASITSKSHICLGAISAIDNLVPNQRSSESFDTVMNGPVPNSSGASDGGLKTLESVKLPDSKRADYTM